MDSWVSTPPGALSRPLGMMLLQRTQLLPLLLIQTIVRKIYSVEREKINICLLLYRHAVRLCVCFFCQCVSITQTETQCLSAFPLYQLNSSPSDIFALPCINSVIWPQVLCQPFLSHPLHSFHLTFFLRRRDPTFTSSPHSRSRPFMLERSACGSMASMRLTDYCNSYTLISCTNH